jgi:ubiquinone/menaquinone biosynthesis C-methylase UbiE
MLTDTDSEETKQEESAAPSPISDRPAEVTHYQQQLNQFSLPISEDLIKSNIKTSYGKNDLAKLANFKGNFINFGLWSEEQLESGKEISNEERIEASRALYTYTVKPLAITPEDSVLEIGCGQGVGTAHVQQLHPQANLQAIDITPEQVERARTAIESVTFSVGDAEQMTFDSETFDKIYSVEVAQHFPNFSAAAKEMIRVLKPSGQLSFCAHFATSFQAYETMKAENLFVNEGIDCLVPMPYVLETLTTAGFSVRQFNTISEDVFPGYDAWFEQKKKENPDAITPWSKKIYQAYERGLLGYYHFFAKKPKKTAADAKPEIPVLRAGSPRNTTPPNESSPQTTPIECR